MRVVVNAAMSADGKLSTRRREPVAISGPQDFARVDRLRADADAVMVGVGTVLADDPNLTVEDPELRAERTADGRPPHPARVVADTQARTPADARILDDRAATYVLVGVGAPTDRVAALEEHATVIAAGGVDVDSTECGDDARRVDLPTAFDHLEAEGIDRLMVEGGGELVFSLFADDLVDELSVFVGPQVIGGRDAPTLADGEGFLEQFSSLVLDGVERLDGGVLLSWTVGNRRHG